MSGSIRLTADLTVGRPFSSGFGALGLAFSSIVGRIDSMCVIEVAAFAWMLGRLNSPMVGILGRVRFTAELGLGGAFLSDD